MSDTEVHVIKLRDAVPGDFYVHVAKNDKRYVCTVIARADNKLTLFFTGIGKIHVIPMCAPPSLFTPGLPGLVSLSNSIVNVLRPVKK